MNQGKRGKSQFKSRPRNLETTCDKCKEKGHYKYNCLKLKAGESRRSVETEYVAISKDDDSENILVVNPRKSYSSEWILDIGCSYHV